jgi:predicted protein tyrosine phosphatase
MRELRNQAIDQGPQARFRVPRDRSQRPDDTDRRKEGVMTSKHGHQLTPAEPGGLAVGSLSQARTHHRRYDALLTLEDPRAERRERLRRDTSQHGPQLVLRLEDVDTETGDIAGPERKHAAALLAFGPEHANGSLLIHCRMGVGRSTAAALAILAERLGPGNEADALATLLEIRPCACPNLALVAHADAELGRAGALTAAVEGWQAGRPDIMELRKARAKFVQANLRLYARRLPVMMA